MNVLKIKDVVCEYRLNPMGLDARHPRFSWKLVAQRRNTMQDGYRIQVSKSADFQELSWDSGEVQSDASVHVSYEGEILKPRTRYYYRIRVTDNYGQTSDWSETAFWETGLMSTEGWKAQWITTAFQQDEKISGPCPMLRKAFSVSREVKEARAYVTSLGLYELHINGQRTGDDYLTPGWTNYHKRLQYQVYDITKQLHRNENAVGIILGEGWYKGNLTWNDQRNLYGKDMAALVQIHIQYEDGHEEMIISDESWTCGTGPILNSEIYHGEIYDANLEARDWSEADFDDGLWKPVQILDIGKAIITAQENVPVRIVEEIKPKEVMITPNGETVLDFGQNMVGWVRFSLSGKKGEKLVIKHAEVLDKEGNFYTENLRSARQVIEYIFKGDGVETFEPHFTFQGFRYIQLVEYPKNTTQNELLTAFTGCVIYSDMQKTGQFECSDQMINQLQQNIQWGQKGNFVDVPTDCPQRDERLGWTGDAQAFVRAACFNMNTAPFFTKWLKDLASEQTEAGGVPYVIPEAIGKDAHSSAAWGDAATIVPWTVYLCYGDERLLADQYESMKAWVEYIRKQGDNEYLWNTGSHFGDWLGLDAKADSYVGATAKDFIATAFYAYSTSLVVKAAKVLKNKKDVQEYQALYDNILENLEKEFVTPNGRLAVPTQTGHVLALKFGLLDKYQKRTIKTLVEYLEESKVHLTTGFVGTPYLCHALSENGRLDMAYQLLKQKDYPSWLYPITKGATTIWEHWDGIKEDGSFWSKDMNSYNHYAYGAVGDWLYQVVAGLEIDPEKPGYKHMFIQPQIDPAGPSGLSHVKVTYESLYGQILSGWQQTEDEVFMDMMIPANTTATVKVPVQSVEMVFVLEQQGLQEDALSGHEKETVAEGSISGNKIPVCKMEGLLDVVQTKSGVELKLGSGEYRLTYKKSDKIS